MVFGKALGCAVGIKLCAGLKEGEVQGVILENAWLSVRDLLEFQLPFLGWVCYYLPFIQTEFWDSIKVIEHIKAPIIFVCGQ